MAKYSAEELRALGAKGHAFKNPDGSFSYPIGDEEDLTAAVSAVGRGSASHNAIRKYIIRRAKAMGKQTAIPDNWNPDGSLKGGGRSMTAPTPYTRSFALDDISVRAGGDGRTVDAYMAIFNVPVPIRDQDGVYEEEIDPACFNRAISDAAPNGSRKNWKVSVFYNHGMTIHGTPSDRHSEAVGIPLDIRPDSKGVLTTTRYTNDDILDGIKDGRYSAYSFSGAFRRSDPTPTSPFRERRDGSLTRVRRLESTLREYGPTPFPAYDGAEVVGVRAEQAALLLGSLSPDERGRLVEMFRSGAPLDSPDVDASADAELVAEDSRRPVAEMRSGRSPKQELQAQRARFLIRHGGI